MGFPTGFTGGVALTLTLAYLAVLTHQRTRLDQSRALHRAQVQAHLATSDAQNLDGTPLFPSVPITKTPAHGSRNNKSFLYPSSSSVIATTTTTTTTTTIPRAEIQSDLDPRQLRPTALSRRAAGLVELAKDRWNAELTGAVRWAQAQDWDEWRQGAEGALARLAGKARDTLAAISSAADRPAADATGAAAAAEEEAAKKGGEGVTRTWWQR